MKNFISDLTDWENDLIKTGCKTLAVLVLFMVGIFTLVTERGILDEVKRGNSNNAIKIAALKYHIAACKVETKLVVNTVSIDADTFVDKDSLEPPRDKNLDNFCKDIDAARLK